MTLVVLPAWEAWLLRAIVALAAIAVVVGVALAAAAEDRDDPLLLPAILCIVLGAVALVATVGVALRWTTSIALDASHVRVTRALLPARTLARAAIDRAVLATVLRPTRLGPEPARRLLLVDDAGRTRVRATWTERPGRPVHALPMLADAGLRAEELPASVGARELEARHPGATTLAERRLVLILVLLVAAGLLAALTAILL